MAFTRRGLIKPCKEVPINIEVKKYPKLTDAVRVKAKRIQNLRGSTSCKREKKQKGKRHMCSGCPYRQTESYCFPCMIKILEE